jgi:hypothetical protein
MQRTKRLEIKLGGKVRPMLFDHAFLDHLTEDKTLTDLDEIQTKKPWRYIPTLALAALKSASEFENKKEKLTYEQVAKWIEEQDDSEELNQIVKAYETSMGFTLSAVYGKDVLQRAVDLQTQRQSPDPSTGTPS